MSEVADNEAAEDRPANPVEDLSHPGPVLRGGLGVPWLFAVVYSVIGFSIYFALGVVADRGLGLTPVIFLVAGLLFVLTTLTYVEGGAMFRERGGSSTFARYAFNELIAFIAGWAILIDYLIIIALAALSVPHYLEPITPSFGTPGWEIGIGGLVIAAVCATNILDLSGRNHRRRLVVLALADLGIQLAVIIVGVIVIWHPSRLTHHLELFSSPTLVNAIYATIIATLAYAGIEAASNLAPDLDLAPRDLKRIVTVGALTVPLIYAGMAVIALMAVPVIAGPHGPETALGSRYVGAPVLGVVSSFHPSWLSQMMRWAVAVVAAPVLIWAADTSMLGVSRHIYTLAINRQIPSWLGKLGTGHSTPYIAIGVSGIIAFGLLIPTDVHLLAGIFAFGSMLAITIAHLSIVRLRTKPEFRERERPFRIAGTIRWRGAELPAPAMLAALATGLGFISVLAFHSGARWVGIGWMTFGLGGYVVYRVFFEGISITKRVSVTPEALTKQVRDVEYARILVPVFGTKLDADIVGTAGRLAERQDGDAQGAKLEIVYVVEVPLTLPLDAKLGAEQEAQARESLRRAKEVGEEYESVEVTTEIVPARSVGAAIVEEARRRGVEAIVMGGEPPTRIRGGAALGGIGAAQLPEVGESTEYVLKRAPCRVLLTAPPAADEEPAAV